MDRQIIVVTREAHLRDSLVRVCSGQGCSVGTADSVAIGLEIAARGPVCAVVADASLQVVGDGVGLAKAIHKQNPDAQCFLIVKEDPAHDMKSEDSEPWLRFIHTPIPMLRFAAELVDVIHESCG
ncbi:MAG: hypothetical protein ABGZ53_14835 [Fuerstiella sp.]